MKVFIFILFLFLLNLISNGHLLFMDLQLQNICN
jgi:hypothetical protein